MSAPALAAIAPRDRSLRAMWRLLVPFWTSQQRYVAFALLAAQLALMGVNTYTSVWYNRWTGDFSQAIVRYDSRAIHELLLRFTSIVLIVIAVSVANVYVRNSLLILWRKSMTERFIDRWLQGNRFYRIELENRVDNPDQRISEDVKQFISSSSILIIGGVATLVSAVTFATVLWNLSGSLHLTVFGSEWAIHGYILYAAIAYSITATLLAYVFGRRLMPLTFEQERAEANFRFQLAGVREQAEQIALYHGGDAERRQGKRVFREALDNLWRIVFFNMRFEPYLEITGFITFLVPQILALPQYLAHEIAFGDIARIAGAFMTLNGALSWFVNNFTQIQQYRAVVARLDQIEGETRESVAGDGKHELIGFRSQSERALTVSGLEIKLPDGRVLLSGLSFSMRRGERWIIRGKSGIGKSTLMRVLAGIWPYGTGEVALPGGCRLLFLSQKNYIPRGTLKAAICYPARPELFDDELCEAVLRRCELPAYVRSLYCDDRWSKRLSPGEQQRIAVARVLLQRPDFVLLDESTNALDEATERKLYQKMMNALPEAAFISISHHDKLDVFHTDVLQIADDGGVATFPVQTVPRAAN